MCAKRWKLLLLLGLCLALLCRCAVLELEGQTTASTPNLSLLRPGVYAPDAQAGGDAQADGAYYKLDLWLDGTQTMGGVNPNETSIYPHRSRAYREGGFHYFDLEQRPWYESVLKDMVLAAGERQVRALRYGNEIFSDEYLAAAGLAAQNATAEQLSSLRRDLMTYALTPTTEDFAAMTAENMTDSFYALGTPMLNQMARFRDSEGAELENPGRVAAMSDALDAQIAAIAAGEGERRGFLVARQADSFDCPLAYALRHMDTTRLNAVIVDTASVRRLSGLDAEGRNVSYFEELLRNEGLMTERGLSVGLIAFQLDYMGQISSICEAELAEPLLWGKPFVNGSNQVLGLDVMPRQLLALVIGPQSEVEAYLRELGRRLDAEESLRGERGPDRERLPYTVNGATVYGEPFAFAYKTAMLTPPTLGYYTQNTPGCTLSSSDGSAWDRRNGLDTVTLLPQADGAQPDRILTVTLPIQPEAGVRLDTLTAERNGAAEVLGSLVLTDTLENTLGGAYQPAQGEQSITLRDKVYVYRRQERPFADAPGISPFTLAGLRLSEDEKALRLDLRVDGDRLVQGYYRVQLLVDVTGEATTWQPIPWVDGYLTGAEDASGALDDGSLNADVSSDDVYRWETFTAAMARVERKKTYISELFRHAWGKRTERPYEGMTVPDCPPVYRLLRVRDLVNQFRAAGTRDVRPYVRFTLDVFVENRAEP